MMKKLSKIVQGNVFIVINMGGSYNRIDSAHKFNK